MHSDKSCNVSGYSPGNEEFMKYTAVSLNKMIGDHSFRHQCRYCRQRMLCSSRRCHFLSNVTGITSLKLPVSELWQFARRVTLAPSMVSVKGRTHSS